MAFIAAPTSNYNSLASVADADTFHTDRQNAAWSNLDTGTKQVLLIKATDYIEANYRFYDDVVTDVVEPLVVEAVAMLALYANTHDLFPVEEDRTVTQETNSIGKASISKTYAHAKADRFPTVTGKLATLASFAPATNGGTVSVGRIIK